MKTTNYCGTAITVIAWISLVAGIPTTFFGWGEHRGDAVLVGLSLLLSSPMIFAFAKIVKAAHIYIDKNSEERKPL